MVTHKDVSMVLSRAPFGLAAPEVRVEVHLGPGLPMFVIVGLPETVVRESKERVRSALVTGGFSFPAGRITVNLSPADLPKEGGRFDLPIAVGILAAGGLVPARALERREFYGELSLVGELRRTPKLLPALIEGAHADHELIIPRANELEAGFLRPGAVKLASGLDQVIAALRGHTVLASAPARSGASMAQPDAASDLNEVRGQLAAKRALEIAAAAQHGLLLVGPPGTGKTLLAQRLAGLLPPLSEEEALQVACVESMSGRRPGAARVRPFRSPQHTASVGALLGGGEMRPGEMSLAHHGVLFLDELPEFPRNALEALREPLESGIVTLRRLHRTCEYPARFQLIAAMNPCPCGYAGDPRRKCRCTAEQIARYRGKISGPLLDRIDMHVVMRSVPVEELLSAMPVSRDSVPADAPGCAARAECSADVAKRVAAARCRQMQRQGKLNAELTPAEVAIHCGLDRQPRVLLETAVMRIGLSARACHRVLKVARTCADLAGEERLSAEHVAEAVQLRALEGPG